MTPLPPFTTYRAQDGVPQDALERALLFAAYWRPDEPLPAIDQGLQRPDLAKLLIDWGRPGDTAVIAGPPERSVGAAWFRLWTSSNHSYGFINDQTPELGIGVTPGFRRRGIGRNLLRRLIEAARDQGFPALSLSVERDNPAGRLYQQEGFETFLQEGQAITMRLTLD